jgi:hypothetical protein
VKVRREYLDIDYFDKLNDEEKEFYCNFLEGHLHASFKPENEEMFTDEMKKEAYDSNNGRNRCIYSISKANNLVVDVEKNEDVKKILLEASQSSDINLQEDALIAEIDRKNIAKKDKKKKT